MKNQALFVTVLTAGFLAGCVTQAPQTAEEFRKAIPGSMFGKTETFEVNRPFRTIADTFQKRAPECLAVKIRSTTQSQTMYHVTVTSYRPTVLVGKDRAELHLRMNHEAGVVEVGNKPQGGYYHTVVDVYPTSPAKSRVQIFGSSMGSDALFRAIRNWATGENLGCPDLTKG